MITVNEEPASASIKVFGFGGCGCNTISTLYDSFHSCNIKLIAANTDFFTLTRSKAHKRIRLGAEICKGLGAGGDVNLGRMASEETWRELISAMRGASLVFLTAGMGGGTGSGAIEIAARIARSLDIPTIAFISLPFSFESERRKSNAYEATIRLKSFANTLISIPNDKLLSIGNKASPLHEIFKIADTQQENFISGLLDLIAYSNGMHIDLSYIMHSLSKGDSAFIFTGVGREPGKIDMTLENILKTTLLDPEQLKNADRAIIKLTGNLRLEDVQSAISYLKSKINKSLEVSPIVVPYDINHDGVRISILLTGLGATPIAYPQSWLQKHEKDFSPEFQNSSKVQSQKSHQPEAIEDILEVPAYLRKKQNLD